MAGLARTAEALTSPRAGGTLAGGMMRLGGPLPSPGLKHPPGRAPTDPEWRDPNAHMPYRPGHDNGVMSYEQPVTRDWVNEAERRLDLMPRRNPRR